MPKIVIRTPNHLGDCVMALSMINETREAYAGAQVTVLTPQPLAKLFHHNPAIDTIIEIPAAHIHGLLAVMKVRDLISPHAFDIGFILPPSFGSAASFKLGGVKERIGYITDGRRLLLTRPLALPEPLNEIHRSELYFNLLRRGANEDLLFPTPKLFLNDEDANSGTALLKQFGITERDAYACVAFRSVAESRRWGMENYRDLIKVLISRFKLKVVLIGSAADQEEGTKLAQATSTKEVINLAGKTDLREAAAILSGAHVFVGNDSGPAHLAASVGTPIVVLSGADDPKATSPVTTRKTIVYLDNLGCISCEKNKCPLKGDEFMQCMKNISIPMVVNAVEKMLNM